MLGPTHLESAQVARLLEDWTIQSWFGCSPQSKPNVSRYIHILAHMTLKLRFPGRFGPADRQHQLPNASDDSSKTSTKTSSLSSGASSCSSSSYQARPPLPDIIASNVTPPTIADTTIATDASVDRPPKSATSNLPVASFSPQQPPAAATPHLPNLSTTSTIIAHGTLPLAPSARRSSWRSTSLGSISGVQSLGSMRSINEDAELPSDGDDDDLEHFGDNRDKQNVTDEATSSNSRFPFLSYRASLNSSLTSVSSCPATTSSSSTSKREVREEKIRRKNFEARRREFATGNPRRLSEDERSTSSGEDPRQIRRRRQSIDFLREESQAASMNGDADNDCYYCHHGGRCLNNYRPRSSSLDDSSDQRLYAEPAPTGQGCQATKPFDTMSARQTLIDSYYGEQDDACTWNDNSSTCSIINCPCQQSPTTTVTCTGTSDMRRSSMPISITEDESDEECAVGNSSSYSNANVNASRNGSNIGLLEDLEGRGLLKVQNAGLAGAVLYYDTEHRRLSL